MESTWLQRKYFSLKLKDGLALHANHVNKTESRTNQSSLSRSILNTKKCITRKKFVTFVELYFNKAINYEIIDLNGIRTITSISVRNVMRNLRT